MQNTITFLRFAIFILLLLPSFGFGQTLTESFQKLVWRECAAPSSYFWESKLPAADCTAIQYTASNQMETFSVNANGLPESCILYDIENGQMLPQTRSTVTYSAWDHVSELQVWRWENGEWQRDMQFRRSFDASGNDLSFFVEEFQDGSWNVLEHWQKPSPTVSSTSLTVAAMRP